MLYLLGGFAILGGLLMLVYLFVNADPARLVEELQHLPESEVMCFGHAPHLDALIARLVGASAAFTDDVIGKLRAAYARDLIVEKVDDEQPGPKREKAVYAVNPSGSADSRVVADITLKHQ